jgi:hypothetical protein
MKWYPQNWSTRQVSFFAGVLSRKLELEQLKRLIDQCVQESHDRQLYFAPLVERIEPFIPKQEWDRCVADCSQIFASSHLEDPVEQLKGK